MGINEEKLMVGCRTLIQEANMEDPEGRNELIDIPEGPEARISLERLAAQDKELRRAKSLSDLQVEVQMRS